MLEDMKDLEAIEIGLNLEKDGIHFYTAAAKKMEGQDVEAAAVLRQLAEEEQKHYQDFLKKRNELTGNEHSGHAGIARLMKKLVHTGIFAPFGESAQKIASVTEVWEIFAMAIRAEKDSIFFYHEAADSGADDSGRRMYRWLIGEETRHLRKLGELYEKYR